MHGHVGLHLPVGRGLEEQGKVSAAAGSPGPAARRVGTCEDFFGSLLWKPLITLPSFLLVLCWQGRVAK